MTVDAIDISHWQPAVDFAAVARAGVVGVIHKVSEGSSYTDPTYAGRKQQALDAGLRWGGYHFLKHGSVAKQMAYFLDRAILPSGSRLVIDYEDTACTLDDLQQAIEELARLDPTAEIATYCGGLLKGQVTPSKAYPWLSATSLWLAHYTTGDPSWPEWIWPYWSLWQYSDKGSVPGVEGECDVNEFNGGREQCAAWFGPASAEPLPKPTPLVAVDIRTPPGVAVTVTVNGEEIV